MYKKEVSAVLALLLITTGFWFINFHERQKREGMEVVSIERTGQGDVCSFTTIKVNTTSDRKLDPSSVEVFANDQKVSHNISEATVIQGKQEQEDYSEYCDRGFKSMTLHTYIGCKEGRPEGPATVRADEDTRIRTSFPGNIEITGKTVGGRRVSAYVNNPDPLDTSVALQEGKQWFSCR